MGSDQGQGLASGYVGWAGVSKLHDLLEAIKERVEEILPWGGDVHELFEKVDSGEIGKRAGIEAEGLGLSSPSPQKITKSNSTISEPKPQALI